MNLIPYFVYPTVLFVILYALWKRLRDQTMLWVAKLADQILMTDETVSQLRTEQENLEKENKELKEKLKKLDKEFLDFNTNLDNFNDII